MYFCFIDLRLGSQQCDIPGLAMDVGFTPRLAGRFNRLESFVDVPPRIVELAEFGACSRHMGNVPWNKHDRAARLPGSNACGIMVIASDGLLVSACMQPRCIMPPPLHC